MKRDVFGRLLRYMLRHFRWRLIAVILCIVVGAIAPLAGIALTQKIVDTCIIPGLSAGLDAVWKALVAIALKMAFIYVLGIVCTAVYTQLMACIGQATLHHLRDDMFKTMEALPIRFFDTHARGDIMSRFTNDIDAIRQLIGQSLPMLLQAVLTILFTVSVMFSYSVWLALLALAVVVVMARIARRFGSQSGEYMGRQQASLAKTESYIEEIIQGEKVVKVFNHEQESKDKFDALNEQLFSDCCNANRTGNELMPILNNVGNLMYVMIAIVGGVMIMLHAPNLSLAGMAEMTIGIIISFLSMSRSLSMTIGQIAMQVPIYTMGVAGAERVFELIDQKPEEDNGYVALVNVNRGADGALTESPTHTGLWAWKYIHKDGSVEYEELHGKVELDHVDFGYTPDKQVLFDVSLLAQPGQKIAFVGTTGAGKTTITNLINRFYDIPDGKVRFDGVNITKIRKPDLRRSLGMVLQEVNLFSGTVMDNIRYGKLDATDEECVNAAKLANAHDFISRLPDGYQTEITAGGGRLSQGQRQLISIARAAVADPPVMILDEATSSIDSRTEALVQAGMDNLMKGRTVFVIAHRLSTVRNSDAIMVLDHGRIIERGTHDELMAMKGSYFQLCTGAKELT